ncbi:MAG: porin [Gammaproteobacteria bacterium]
MANQFSKTKLAAAVGAAAFGAGLAAPAGAVVVVGGNDGWEVSFDGNVNAFYTVGDYDNGYFTESADKDSSRVHSGFLPAFFSFNVKSPTVNGMTGSARISFAPTIQNGGNKTQFNAGIGNNGSVPGINGAQIDTREVLANLSGAFGEVSFGRTLSLFGRNAILNDMTLFGVGFAPGADHFGSVTFGRVGHGYTYPDFSARFQYTTPVVNGFQLAVGLYDPSNLSGVTSYAGGPGGAGGMLDETDTPRFEGELSYSTAFSNGTAKLWLDGSWQDIDSSCTGIGATLGGVAATCGSITAQAWGAGAKLGYMGFEFVGYYYDQEGLGLTAQFNGASVYVDANGNVRERQGDGYYIQGTYTFSGKTKVGLSYGEGNLDSIGATDTSLYGFGTGNGNVERTMWTVGVYHDVNSWLRLIAEYNHGQFDRGIANDSEPEADTFSVGGFLFW